MKIHNIYQDNEGNWHIDYSPNYLVGLAFRVYLGELILWLYLLVPVVIISALMSFTFNKSLPEENTCSFSDFQPDSVCYKRD